MDRAHKEGEKKGFTKLEDCLIRVARSEARVFHSDRAPVASCLHKALGDSCRFAQLSKALSLND